MTSTPSALRDSAFLKALLDVVMPASKDGTMPAAGSLGLSPGLAAALEVDPTLGPVALAGLDVVQSQLQAHPRLMMAVARHLYPAYYQHPQVLEAIGEPARPPFPEGFDVEPTDPGLPAKLRARGRA